MICVCEKCGQIIKSTERRMNVAQIVSLCSNCEAEYLSFLYNYEVKKVVSRKSSASYVEAISTTI